MQTPIDLPSPEPDALAHSAHVTRVVIERVAAAGGFLGFADYMDAVLYAPGLGYYSAGAPKFGAAGDFITAPELGGVFARCLARPVRAALAELGGGTVVEVGGGTGALAAGLLHALQESPPDRYLLLEVSAELRERQQRTIADKVPGLLSRVSWLDALPEGGLQGVLVANEVLDALPVERFRWRSGRVYRLGVGVEQGRLAWVEQLATPELDAAVREVQTTLGSPFAEGHVGEIGLRQRAWLQALLGSFTRGLALFIDYGGSRRDIHGSGREGGTLSCFYRHRRHDDPFFLPGLQDITAWVDFSAAAEAARQAGWDLVSYATQAHMLLACGVLGEAEVGIADADRLREAQQIQRLLLPGEMGERFKLLALAREYQPGFALAVRDLRERL